jgi:hypothetical protein
MGRSPRTVTLVDAFRVILRAIYPDRPALADEIQSYDWDYFFGHRWWFETNLTSDEVIAVNKALKLLDEFVEEGIRLRGALHPSKPLGEIDSADVSGSKLDVFAEKLRVFHGNKHIKTYYRVHCYETETWIAMWPSYVRKQSARNIQARPDSKDSQQPIKTD